MSKYNNAREQVKQLLTSNKFPADVGIWSEFLKIIDGLEAEDEWLAINIDSIPNPILKIGYMLLLKTIEDCDYSIFYPDILTRQWQRSSYACSSNISLAQELKPYRKRQLTCFYKLVKL